MTDLLALTDGCVLFASVGPPPPSMGSIFRGLLWLGEAFPDTEMK